MEWINTIITYAKSDTGVTLAWIATILSFGLSLLAYFFSKSVRNEHYQLKLKIENLNNIINNNQKIGDENTTQNGKNNINVKTNTGGININ